MKAKSTRTLSFLLLLILLFPVNAFAQLFGSDEENWNRVFVELKKIHSRLVTLETEEMDGLKRHLENMLGEIEEVKHAVPQLQGAVELNKFETLSGLEKTNAKLDDLAAKVKNQVLEKIRQQNKNLQEGLAQDIEKFEQSSKTNFLKFAAANNKTLERVVQQLEAQSATTKKGFDDIIALFRTDVIPTIAEENQKSRKMMLDHLTHANTETRKTLEASSAKNQQLNQNLIKILQESLKQGLDTKSLLDSIKKDMEITRASMKGTNQNLEKINQNVVNSHSVITEVQEAMVVTNKNLMIAEKKNNRLAKGLQNLQTQNSAFNKALGALKANLEQAGEFNRLADEKLNKLIDHFLNLATHFKELENSVVGQLKDSAQKEDARTIKVDLVNEKLSRLIEILKEIAMEQKKLGPVATTLAKMQKEQEALQETQTGLRKSQGEIKEALADLRRKANVNISRNDDIKKTLGQLSSSKSKTGGQ